MKNNQYIAFSTLLLQKPYYYILNPSSWRQIKCNKNYLPHKLSHSGNIGTCPWLTHITWI